MMSSEEEADPFGLYGDKLLKKAKRSRQRVDAGEPRNSYSSIPNFSSRPSFLNSGLYGALFSQNHQHLGLGPFGPSKMLNELLGRQMKPTQDASAPTVAMESGEGFDCLSGTPIIRRGLEEEGSPPPGEVAAHHMLRDILQGRKKELMALEQELRTVTVSGATEPPSPDNNNSIINNNNNNNELKNNVLLNGSDMSTYGGEKVVNGVREVEAGGGDEEVLSEEEGKAQEEGGVSGGGSDTEASIPSPSPAASEKGKEGEEGIPGKSEAELKRARVENIVSLMGASPSLPQQVNGCKKRKLYHPQQHEAASDRYSSLYQISVLIDDDTVDNNSLSTEEIRQKKVEKDALKSQLRSMHQQLAEMQQKYVQLCERMDQDECGEAEEVSETEPDNSNSLPDKGERRSPSPAPKAASPPAPPLPASPVLPKSVPKLPTPVPHPMTVPPNFNGALSLLQQQVLQEQSLGQGPKTHPVIRQQQALTSAAAMYHKLFLEQEARLSKEAEAQRELSRPPPSAPNPPPAPPLPSQQSPSPQSKPVEFPERLPLRGTPLPSVSGSDLEGLAGVLKSEISSSLGNLIDSIMSRFVQKKRYVGKGNESTTEQLNKDIMLASQLLDRKSPRTKVIDRGNAANERSSTLNGIPTQNLPPRINGTAFSNLTGPPQASPAPPTSVGSTGSAPEPSPAGLPTSVRPGPLFPPPKVSPALGSSSAAAAAAVLYSSMGGHNNPFCMAESREGAPEQNEALSLVVVPKKKRHKVTDTRITPRTVSRILAQDGLSNSQPGLESGVRPHQPVQGPPVSESPPPQKPVFHFGPAASKPPAPPPMLPVSLPTSVAIPNPSLHESKVFSPYSPFYQGQHLSTSSPPVPELRESPPLGGHGPSLLHPALLAAAQHAASPDYGIRAPSNIQSSDTLDRSPDCNSIEASYDGSIPTISFYYNKSENVSSLTDEQSSTLTPMHLRKAKLMFFWVRYPSSAVLKMYFPDIKFNKNNTAQLVKWFSNFREFYYIQMEKYARQAVSEGVKSPEDLHVSGDCEIYRVLNLHYNRNNHIEVPPNFRYVVEQTLREFFRSIQTGKDTEQSWKKSIYKIISRLDDPVPEYFKSPNFLEQLE